MGVGAANTEGQWHWMVDKYNGYNPLCEHLENEFGVEFVIEQTGGGCHAIIAEFATGYKVWLTMAEDVLETYQERVIADAEGFRAGWAAGVYGPVNDFCEAIGWAADARMRVDDHVGVTQLVRRAIASAPAPET